MNRRGRRETRLGAGTAIVASVDWAWSTASLLRPANKRNCQHRAESHRHASNAPTPAPAHDDVVHSESFLQSLMRRQLSLSISCAATFFVALLGLPLLNYFAPDTDGDAGGRFHPELARPRRAVLPVRVDHLVRVHQALDCAGRRRSGAGREPETELPLTA